MGVVKSGERLIEQLNFLTVDYYKGSKDVTEAKYLHPVNVKQFMPELLNKEPTMNYSYTSQIFGIIKGQSLSNETQHHFYKQRQELASCHEPLRNFCCRLDNSKS